MVKFDFCVQTKDGQRVESVVIAAADQESAERKLRQMYRYCEIIRCTHKGEEVAGKMSPATSIEDILTMISK